MERGEEDPELRVGVKVQAGLWEESQIFLSAFRFFACLSQGC